MTESYLLIIVMAMVAIAGILGGLFLLKNEFDIMLRNWKVIAEEKGIVFYPTSFIRMFLREFGEMRGKIEGFNFKASMESETDRFSGRNRPYYSLFEIELENAGDKRLSLDKNKGLLNYFSSSNKEEGTLEQQYTVRTNDGEFAINVLDNAMKKCLLDGVSKLDGNWKLDGNILSYRAKIKLDNFQARKSWSTAIDTGVVFAKAIEAYCSDRKD